jgi:hypothetical protein
MGASILPRMDLTMLPDEVQELVRAQLEAGRFQSRAASRPSTSRDSLSRSRRSIRAPVPRSSNGCARSATWNELGLALGRVPSEPGKRLQQLARAAA